MSSCSTYNISCPLRRPELISCLSVQVLSKLIIFRITGYWVTGQQKFRLTALLIHYSTITNNISLESKL